MSGNTPSRARPAGRGAPEEERGVTEAKPLSHDTVQALSRMIKDLEEQLDRMLAINEAMEKELASERKRRVDIERTLAALEEKLRRAEEEAASTEGLQAEISELDGERVRLASTVEELGRQVAEAAQKCRGLSRQAERLRLERDDTLEELNSVEEQFNRAMDVVADLRTRLAVLAEERDALKARLKLAEEDRQQSGSERDALLAEVEESRKALEEIRRSLVDACVVSQRPLT